MANNYPTNQEVFNALNRSIDKWKRVIANNGKPVDMYCALCRLDDKFYTYFFSKDKYYSSCTACPLKIFTKTGCGINSAWHAWHSNKTKENAQAVIKDLFNTKKHFFGDWK